MFLSVTMPAYNEEANIEAVVREHVAVLERMQALENWEIVVVDDGSADRTAAILAEMQRADRRIRAIRQTNQGIFGAFSRCHREARGTHIYSTGSDGQWPAENLPLMLRSLQAGADLVVGARTNRRKVYSLSRRLVSAAFNLLPRIVFGAHIEDAGSVKLGIRDVFQMPLISRSPFFEAERIIRAQRTGLRVTFVPIEFRLRPGGKASGASWKNIRNSLADLVRCASAMGLR